MSPQAIDFSKYEQSAPPTGGQIDFSKYEQRAPAAQPAQPSVMQVLTQPTDKTDKEYMGYTGPAGVVGATVHGLNDVAQSTKDAIKGVYESSAKPPQDAGEKGVFLLGGPPALQTYRMLRGLGHSAADATHVAAAIHDINQSPDPLGTYAGAAERTAAQGAGQALTAIGTEGVTRAVPALTDLATSEVAPAVRATVRGINKGLAKAPGTIGGTAGAAVGGYLGGHVGAEVGGAAGAMAGREILPQVRIPGEGFGLPDRVTGGPEVAPQYEAPAEGEPAPEEPAQPLPKPKAKTVKQSTALGPNAQVRTQAQALGQPRTIVTDPATGRPEFSDVVAAKQQTPAPVETKAAPVETPAAQPAVKGTPAETPGPAADDLLQRLKGVADRIQKQETAAPGSADDDLVQQAQDSLDMVRARKAIGPQPKTPGESLDEFNQRLSAIADRKAAAAAANAPGGASSGANSLNGIFNRLVKGEAGQAGLPGTVTNADEGIAEIQNRPVIAQRTEQVPARGYLRAVGADENSVLKTPRDQDSVFWHRQQIAQSGQPPDVELHVDEGNNVIGAQGRHRAIAAVQQGGPKAMVNVTVFKHPDPAPR